MFDRSKFKIYITIPPKENVYQMVKVVNFESGHHLEFLQVSLMAQVKQLVPCVCV